jgi:dUTP pyrophosphatase
VRVKIQRVRDVPLPEYQTEGAAGFDLAPADDVEINPGQTVLVPTGLIVATPPGHMLMVVPRSSTAKRWNLSLGNTIGIVDSDYCGPEDELLLLKDTRLPLPPAYGAEPTNIIPAGTRLAQGIIVPVLQVQFFEVEQIGAPTRGGYGSTG